MPNDLEIDVKEVNENISQYHEIWMRNSDKLETLITQISSVFIGAVASFYALTKAPISLPAIICMMGFVACIMLNCLSYLISIWAIKFAIKAESPPCETSRAKAEKLDITRDIFDHASVFIFILSVISICLIIYNEYSTFLIQEKTKEVCVSTTQTETSGTRGLGLPPKKIKPPKEKK
jgi:E3 ubiquitin-protein ligase DOA10